MKRVRKKIEIKRSNRRTYEERTSPSKMAYFKVNEIKLHMGLTGKSFQDRHPDLQPNKALRHLTSVWYLCVVPKAG